MMSIYLCIKMLNYLYLKRNTLDFNHLKNIKSHMTNTIPMAYKIYGDNIEMFEKNFKGSYC